MSCWFEGGYRRRYYSERQLSFLSGYWFKNGELKTLNFNLVGKRGFINKSTDLGLT